MPEITLNDGAASFTPELTRQEATFQVNPFSAPNTSGTITQGRTASGSPVTGGLNANSIVNIGGVETTVRAAMAAGYVQQNQDGTFSMVSQEARQQAQQQRQQEKAQAEAEALGMDGTDAALDQSAEATIATFANHVSPTTAVGAVLDIANGLPIRDSHITQAASQMGKEPAQVRAMVDQVRGAFEAQARSVVDRVGPHADDVFAWASQDPKGRDLMKQAIQDQALKRTTSGYQKVAQAYLENLDAHNPEALLNAQLGEGLEIRKGQNGKLILKTPKGEMEYRSAIKAGLIKISKARR